MPHSKTVQIKFKLPKENPTASDKSYSLMEEYEKMQILGLNEVLSTGDGHDPQFDVVLTPKRYVEEKPPKKPF